MDKDKKIVNTEEQNRPVNPGDSEVQEDSISQEAAHDPSIDSSSAREGSESDKRSVANDVDMGDEETADTDRRVEGDDVSGVEREMP